MRIRNPFAKNPLPPPTADTTAPAGVAYKLSDGFVIIEIGHGKNAKWEWQYREKCYQVSGLATLDPRWDCLFMSPWKMGDEISKAEISAYADWLGSLPAWNRSKFVWRWKSTMSGMLYAKGGKIADPDDPAVLEFMKMFLPKFVASFDMAVEDVIIKMGLDARPVTAALRGVRRDMTSFKTDLGNLFNKFGGIGGLITGAAAGMVYAAKKAINLADELQDVADNLDVSTTTLQRFTMAAEQSGGSSEKAAAGIGKIIETVGEALQGNEKARASFATLGISVKDMASKDNDQLLQIIAQRIGEIEDPAKRVAIAVDLAGKAGKNLVAAFAALGKGDGKGLVVISEDNVAILDRLADYTKLIARVIKVEVGNFIGASLRAVIPGVSEFGNFAKRQSFNQRVIEKTELEKKLTGEKEKQARLADGEYLKTLFLVSKETERLRIAKELAAQKVVAARADLSTAMGDRSRFSLEQLAGIDPATTNRFGASRIRNAKLIQQLEQQAGMQSLAGNDKESGRLQSIADRMRAGNTALTEGERFPFQSLQKGVKEMETALVDTLTKGQARVQVLTGD